MVKPSVQLVWFKRDLRWVDHAPLTLANQQGTVLPLYVFEPALWQQPDASARQWRFIADCLVELDQALRQKGQGLVFRVGEIIDVLAGLQTDYGIEAVWSHQETGNAWTYARDQNVAKWLKDQSIVWHEVPQHPIKRGQDFNRDGWQGYAESFFHSALIPEPLSLTGLLVPPTITLSSLEAQVESFLPPKIAPNEAIQPGGRSRGLLRLQSFLSRHIERYLFDIANPLKSRQHSSRLSPHLAWGSLSIREVIQKALAYQAVVPEKAQRSLSAWLSRLHWQSHFMQKLETEPTLEYRCLQSATESLRTENNSAHLQAWWQGKTGFPLVDACMRCLRQTGWLPFRMRAMLMSFASYPLWLDWRLTAPMLARLFTDYEPGIHYSQVQMQSGTTGINAVRVYNPIKQSYEHDPDGEFIRYWCPELAFLPAIWLHEPWLSPDEIWHQNGRCYGIDYPKPVVDLLNATRHAKQALAKVRKTDTAKTQARQVYQRHGSRLRARRGKPQSSSAVVSEQPNLQLDLFAHDENLS